VETRVRTVYKFYTCNLTGVSRSPVPSPADPRDRRENTMKSAMPSRRNVLWSGAWGSMPASSPVLGPGRSPWPDAGRLAVRSIVRDGISGSI